MDLAAGLISNRYKTCLYYRSRMEKYKLGKETRRFIYKIDIKTEKNYKQILRSRISENKENIAIRS